MTDQTRSPRRPGIGHRPGLDGLRGAAVVAVITYHLGLTPGGFVGVDVFFVLSGFLVTSLLLDEITTGRAVDLVAFWGRRVRRLVPAVLVMVPVALLGALVVGWPPTRLGSTAVDAFATLTWWANWRQASGTSYWEVGAPSLFRHAWSLSIEEQFYLVWPVVVAGLVLITRRRPNWTPSAVGTVAVVGFVLSSAWAIVLSHRLGESDLSRVYVGTDTRILAPLAGCALAAWWWRPGPEGPIGRNPSRRVSGAASIIGAAILVVVVAAVSVDDPVLYHHGGFAVVALASVLLVASVAGSTVEGWARWSTAALPRYLGLRSYGLYLWSWPIQVLIEVRYPAAPRWAVIVAVVTASVLVAEASHRVVEDPLRRGRAWASRPALRRSAWAAGPLLAVLALTVVVNAAEEPPAHQRLDTDDSVAAALDRPAPTAAPTDPDVPDSEPAPLRVMVTGDSVAFTLVYRKPPVEDLPPGVASIDGRGVIGCGQLAADGWHYPRANTGRFGPPPESCARRPEVEQQGLDARPDVVLAVPGAWEYSAARSPDGEVVPARSARMARVLIDSLVRDARRAQAVGASFVMLEWACPGPDAQAERRDPDYIGWINQVMADAASEAVELHGVEAWVLGATDRVCEGGDPTAPPTPEKSKATAHEVHVQDEAGGRWMWHEWLGPELDRRLRR